MAGVDGEQLALVCEQRLVRGVVGRSGCPAQRNLKGGWGVDGGRGVQRNKNSLKSGRVQVHVNICMIVGHMSWATQS